MSVRVQAGDFDVSEEIAQLRAGNAGIGAVVTFIGTVRDMGGEEAVSTLSLEHYPGMTEKSLAEIVAQAKARWPILAARIVHRIGPLLPMEQIVLVAAASRHRADAFAACEFMMDYLKTQAPFWKKEETASGSCWIDAREADIQAVERWQKKEGA